MNDDAAQAAWYQLELEQRRREEDRLLANDPAYEQWLDELNDWTNKLEQVKDNEVPRESLNGLCYSAGR